MRRRLWAARALLVLAGVLGVMTLLAAWIDRQVLDTDQWVQTQSEVIADPAVQQALSDFVATKLSESVDVTSRLQQALPPRAQPLAAPLAGAVHAATDRAVQRAVRSPAVQHAWQTANRITHASLVRAIEDEGRFERDDNGAIVIDLRPFIVKVANDVGIAGVSESSLPPDRGVIKVVPNDELKAIREIAHVFQLLRWALLVVVVALLAGAVWLAPSGGRRGLLGGAGLTFILIGAVIVVLRRAIGTHVVDTLTAPGEAAVAAQSVYRIQTQLLRDMGISTIALGLPLVFAAWIAGPGRWAQRVRRSVAPTLRDQPGAAYGAAFGVYALLVVWAPLAVLTVWWWVLLYAALLAVGIHVLRRQVVAEARGAGPVSAAGSPR